MLLYTDRCFLDASTGIYFSDYIPRAQRPTAWPSRYVPAKVSFGNLCDYEVVTCALNRYIKISPQSFRFFQASSASAPGIRRWSFPRCHIPQSSRCSDPSGGIRCRTASLPRRAPAAAAAVPPPRMEAGRCAGRWFPRSGRR